MPAYSQAGAMTHRQDHHYGNAFLDQPHVAGRRLGSPSYYGPGDGAVHDYTSMLADPYNAQKYPANSHWKNARFQPSGAADAQPVAGRDDYHWLAADQLDAQLRHNAYYNEQQRKKEEKPVGGVSATLDYEMNQMTDFVAEMAAAMYSLYESRTLSPDRDLASTVERGPTPPSQYRKWVLHVLNATRLPSATIILSLSYMAIRVRDLSAHSVFASTERGLYQMLTVALILGSKFLDDNTFQNKSWAEVSSISTAELNRDEREWLLSFNHRLHHDPNCSDGFAQWEKRWLSAQARAASSLANVLHPLDTNVRRRHPTPLQSAYSHHHHHHHHHHHNPPASSTTPASAFARKEYSPNAAYYSAPYAPSYAAYDSWYGPRTGTERSPSTAPHSGPHTPEYYGQQPVWAPLDDYSRRRSQYGQHTAFQPPASYSAFTPGYNPPAYQAGWNTHGVSCQCSNCRQTMQPKFPPIVCG